MKIPTFRINSLPNNYLEREEKVERVFKCFEYDGRAKVTLASFDCEKWRMRGSNLKKNGEVDVMLCTSLLSRRIIS